VAVKKSDSSVRRKSQPGTGESYPFKGEVKVLGRVPGFSPPRKALSAVLGRYLAALELPGASVNLLLVDDEACRRLNRDFRGKDAATDVLSFPAQEGKVPSGFTGHLGDLALGLPYAWKKRGRFAARFEAETAFLLLHGLLHLTGRHHDTAAQERAMNQLHQRVFPAAAGLFESLRGLRPRP
jgi:probable rRNA maturation factor